MSGVPMVITVAQTSDPDEFAESLLPVTPLLRIAPTVAHFRGSARLVPLSRMGLFLPKVDLAHVQKPVFEDLFTVNLPLRESIQGRVGGGYQTIEPGHAYIAGPGSEVDLRTGPSSATLALNIDAALVRAHWLGREDESPNGEPRVISLANGAGRMLFGALSTAWGESLRGEPSDPSELEDRITRALAHCLVPDLAARSSIRGGPKALSRAKAYIRAHLGDRITVPDLAHAAGVSNRTLYRLFLQEDGLTPMRFVTVERLNAARRALLSAGPEELSVTQAALRHGFAHLGRFSIQYRQEFGEKPSKTLRR